MELQDRARPWRRPAGSGRSRAALLGWAMVALGAAAVLLLVWGALSALSMRSHALAAADHVADVQDALEEEDFAAAQAAAEEASRETGEAADAAGALPLVLASHLPGGAGRVVADVRTVVVATDLAVTSGALPLVGVAASIEDPSALLRDDGSIDVDRLSAAAAEVGPAAAALDRARADVAGVDPDALPEQLQDAVRSAKEGIEELAARADSAGAVLSVLPTALGAEGPRSYLVAFQNPAELRPTGGIVGSWALLAVDDGRLALTETGSNDDLERLQGGAVRDLGAEYAQLYPAEDVSYSQNVNLSPHFPHAGRLLTDMWTTLGRPEPDAVVSMDPEGLAPLLRGSGEIEVAGGPAVSADTLEDVMLRQLYERFDDAEGEREERKDYLSAVVAAVFSEAFAGGGFTAEALAGLLQAGDEGHLLVWSPDEELQAALSRAGVTGELPEPTPTSAGVYLTNIAASKLDYYVTQSVETVPACGDAPARMTVRLENDAPEQVPEWVRNHRPRTAPTTESLLVALYLPPERGIDQVRVDGQPVDLSTGTERGWSVARLSVDVPAGATVEITADLAGDPSAVTEVHTQPMVHDVETTTRSC